MAERDDKIEWLGWRFSIAMVLAGLAVPIGLWGLFLFEFSPFHDGIAAGKRRIAVAALLAASSAALLWWRKQSKRKPPG